MGSKSAITVFQSKVGRGLKPKPEFCPVMVASMTELGAIQVILPNEYRCDEAMG